MSRSDKFFLNKNRVFSQKCCKGSPMYIMCIIHMNIKSLPSNIDEFRMDILEKKTCCRSFIRNLISSVRNSGFEIPVFQLFRDHNSDIRRLSGVCNYVQSDPNILIKFGDNCQICQFIFIELILLKVKVLVGYLFKPQNIKNTSISLLEVTQVISGFYQHLDGAAALDMMSGKSKKLHQIFFLLN